MDPDTDTTQTVVPMGLLIESTVEVIKAADKADDNKE